MSVELIEWAGTLFLTISAILVSFSITASSSPWAFLGFLIGHIMWVVAASITQNLALIALNATFIPIDLYAIHIRYKYTNKEN